MKTRLYIEIYTWSSRTSKDGSRKVVDCNRFEITSDGMIQTSVSNEKGKTGITLYATKSFDDGNHFKFIELKNNQTYESHIEVVD